MQTVSRYMVRAETLLEKFDNQTRGSWRDNPMLLCPWLAGLESSLAKNTWRQYKASLICYMEADGQEGVAAALKQLRTTRSLRQPNKTSNQKAKSISDKDLSLLEEQLIAHEGQYAGVTIAWLKAGILTGLRPSEWQHAVIKNNLLTVFNAKQTNDGACSKNRELDISELSEANKAIIIVLIKILQENFSSTHNTCRCLLYRNCRTLWPRRTKHITLYSARHQFVANAKSGGGKVEGVALMSHGSEETAGIHYGGVKSDEQLVEPAQKNIDIIEQRKLKQDKEAMH